MREDLQDMNKVFFSVLTILLIASVYTWYSSPDAQTKYPVLYWKSDQNPQRYEQIDLFQDWLKKKHPELKGPESGLPPFEVKLDAANNQSTLIQSVSGVSGDLLDGVPIRSYAAMGLLVDLSKFSRKGHFGLDTTYPGAAGLITYNGKQYGYPANLAVGGFLINLDTFRKHGVEIPHEAWTTADFERIGKEFDRKANKNVKTLSEKAFFAPAAESFGTSFALIYLRSHGKDILNETMTRSTMNDEDYIKAFKLLYKWTYTDGFLPTAAEVASANVESGGYGGSTFSHFIRGTYGIIVSGRYAMIRFREEPKKIHFLSCQYPQGPYRNMIISTRATALYAGTNRNPQKQQLTRYFFDYLADKDYNDYIIYGADGLPPNPKYADSDAFRKGYGFVKDKAGNRLLDKQGNYILKQYSNEGNIHENEHKWAMTIASPSASSPYFSQTGRDWATYALNKLMNDRATAEEAVREAENRLNAAIDQTRGENPKLAAQWEKEWKIQHAIDRLKAEGKPIPANWITNPFYQKYYRDKGRLAPDAPFPTESVPAKRYKKTLPKGK